MQSWVSFSPPWSLLCCSKCCWTHWFFLFTTTLCDVVNHCQIKCELNPHLKGWYCIDRQQVEELRSGQWGPAVPRASPAPLWGGAHCWWHIWRPRMEHPWLLPRDSLCLVPGPRVLSAFCFGEPWDEKQRWRWSEVVLATHLSQHQLLWGKLERKSSLWGQRHWKRFPGEVVDSPSLKMFKATLAGALSNLG